MPGAVVAIQQGSSPDHPSGIKRGATWQIGRGGQDFVGRSRFCRETDIFGRFHDKNARTHEMFSGAAGVVITYFAKCGTDRLIDDRAARADTPDHVVPHPVGHHTDPIASTGQIGNMQGQPS